MSSERLISCNVAGHNSLCYELMYLGGWSAR